MEPIRILYLHGQDESSEGEEKKAPLGDRVLGKTTAAQRAGAVAAKAMEISVEEFSDGLSPYIELAKNAAVQAEAKMMDENGETKKRWGLTELEIQLGVTGEGKVVLLGTGVEITGSVALVLKFGEKE